MAWADRSLAWTGRHRLDLRDGGVALSLFLLLLAIGATVPFAVLQLPGYLVLIGFDALQNGLVPGLGSGGYVVGFVAYLVVLGLVAVWFARLFRRSYGPADRPWRYGVAGGLLTLGLLAFAELILVLLPNSGGNLTPLLAVLGASLFGIIAGLWLARTNRI